MLGGELSARTRWSVGGASLLAALAVLGVRTVMRRAPVPPEIADASPVADASVVEPVLLSGCKAILHGGACELAGDGAVLLWLPGDAARLVFDVDRVPLTPTRAVLIDGGALVELRPPSPTGSLHGVRDGVAVVAVPLAKARPEPASVIEARRLIDADKLDEAAAVLQADRARAEHDGDGPALLGKLARVLRGLGRDDESDAVYAASIDTKEHAGRDSDAANDGLALVHGLIARSRFADARRALARAETESSGWADGAADIAYYRGLIAIRTGDSRAALAEYAAAAVVAKRYELARINVAVRGERAKVLDAIGRTPEALDDLRALHGAMAGTLSPCERADLEGTIGWIGLHQRAPATMDPLPWLQRSYEASRDQCGGALDGSQRVPESLGDLADAELQAGHTREARARLREAESLGTHLPPELSFELLATHGRVALAEKKSDEASAAFDRLAAGAATVGARGWQVVGYEGAAEARALRGDREGALAALARADAIVDDASAAIPLGEGRESFVQSHAHAEVRRVELLVSLGRPAEALRAVRRSRARLLAGLESADRLASLDAAGRARWDDAVGAYRRERDAIDEEAADDWKFVRETLAARQSARAARAAAAQAALDDALASVVARPGARDGGDAPATPDALVLAFFPTDHGTWLGLADDAGRVRVVDLGAVDAAADAATLATKLLAPFRDEIDRAHRLAVVATGEARRIDVHALPWGDAPLVARLPVVYPIDRRGAPDDAASAAHRALVVIDPTSDLHGARAELDAVTGALAKQSWPASVLRGPAATGGAVREALATSDLFHYSGHGRFAGRDGLASALPLAEHGELTVTDILALPRAPRSVVLLGCETARESEGVRVEGLGLAQAFVLAGARGVVAATRDVGDAATSALAAAIYARGATDGDLAESLRAAQREAWSRGVVDWSAFRALVP